MHKIKFWLDQMTENLHFSSWMVQIPFHSHRSSCYSTHLLFVVTTHSESISFVKRIRWNVEMVILNSVANGNKHFIHPMLPKRLITRAPHFHRQNGNLHKRRILPNSWFNSTCLICGCYVCVCVFARVMNPSSLIKFDSSSLIWNWITPERLHRPSTAMRLVNWQKKGKSIEI